MNIMSYVISFFPTIIGCGAGLVYGYSFVLQYKGMFDTLATVNRTHSLAFFLIRIGILFLFGKYLLQMPLIPFILGSLSFFGVFWLIILQVKAKSHERV